MSEASFISLHDIANVWATMPELCQWVSVIVISGLGGFGVGVWEASRRVSLQQYAELLRWKLEYLHIALKREEAVSNALAQKILTAPELPAAASKVETQPLTDAQRKAEEHLKKVIPFYDTASVTDPGRTIAPIVIPASPPEYSDETVAAMATLSEALKKEAHKPVTRRDGRNSKGQFVRQK